MVFDEDDDDEAQLLLSKSSLNTIEKSKRTLIETRDIGAEVLRSLSGDNEKVRSIKRKQEWAGQNLDEAERSVRSLERSELLQFVFVCLVLFSVVLGLFVVLIRMLIK